MKIALLTANIGGFDDIRPPAKQKHDYDFFYYSDSNLPAPFPHLNNRLKGKYLKTQSHRFLDHDLFIWIDASVEVIDGTFIDWVLQKMERSDVVITLHRERKSVYEEIEHIQKYIKKGDKYLVSRYAKEPFKQEVLFYKKEGLPESVPLYQCWFFARWNNKKLNAAFNDWWDKIIRYSNFDQSQFSFVAHKHNLNINIVDCENYLKRHNHL